MYNFKSMLVLILDEAPGSFEICNDHLFDERVKVDLALPSQDTLCLGRIAEQEAGRCESGGRPKRERVRTRLQQDGSSGGRP